MTRTISPALAAMALTACAPAAHAEDARKTPVPATVVANNQTREVAYFAGGCFWGVEGVFDHVRGVESAVSGYAGGSTARPSYEQVSTGSTGHAETVRVTFNPRKVRYADLLQIYFSVVADPTQLNRQGPDQGTQYRTALFPVGAAQVTQARAYIAQLGRARAFPRPIVTSIEPMRRFTTAEPYHQDYMAAHPNQPYIVVNDRPKLVGLKRLFPQYYRG